MFSAIEDTKADGDCAYVVFRPQVQYSYVGAWLSVGWSGWEKRIQICGNGTTLYQSFSVKMPDIMSSVDKTFATATRMYVRVCLNKSWASDPCDGWYSSPHNM